jgi:Tetracyclin repressor-like, C-terminal domain
VVPVPDALAGHASSRAASGPTQAPVTRPARAQPPGVARLCALVDRWISYAEEPLFPGGCYAAHHGLM